MRDQFSLLQALYLFLLPLFFIFHEYIGYYPAIPLISSIGIFLQLLLMIAGLVLINNFIFKSFNKASLFTFTIIFLYLFYGAAFDFFKDIFGHSIFIKYTFILPFLFVFLIWTFIFIKKSKPINLELIKFLSLVLIVLICYDTITFIASKSSKERDKVRVVSPKLKYEALQYKPDIYLIVTDEYAGNEVLDNNFNFDNNSFINELNQRNFKHIQYSRSNYNSTIFSMASMLHLNYLKIKSDSITLQTILECGNLLNETPFVNFLKQHNYTFYNYSCFDVNNQSKAIRVYFFPTFEELYLSQTLISRVKRDIGFNFLSPKVIESHVKLNLTKDSTIDDLTRKAVNQTGSPKFIYTHFFMPHHPYFINKDSNNKTYSNLELALNQNKDAYISYLKFANNKILDLIEYIQTNSKNPPVIILLSDHGWRKNETKETNHHQFINLSAISLPDSNYSFFDDKLSNVNQLRMLLNTYFKQSLSKLKDSTYFLIEDEIGTK